MVKGCIQEEDITIVNIYAPNKGAARYIQRILINIKGKTDGNTIIVEDFNTPLTSMHRYFQDITSKKIRIHILLKCSWNILKNQPHIGTQSESQ